MAAFVSRLKTKINRGGTSPSLHLQPTEAFPFSFSFGIDDRLYLERLISVVCLCLCVFSLCLCGVFVLVCVRVCVRALS